MISVITSSHQLLNKFRSLFFLPAVCKRKDFQIKIIASCSLKVKLPQAFFKGDTSSRNDIIHGRLPIEGIPLHLPIPNV